MAKRAEAGISQTFGALADPVRRMILARLEHGSPLSVGEIGGALPVKLPGLTKHLDVLERAELIARRRQGRIVLVELRAEPMAEAIAWLTHYQRFWSSSLDQLAEFVESGEGA